jgi:hypothetical protein
VKQDYNVSFRGVGEKYEARNKGKQNGVTSNGEVRISHSAGNDEQRR